MNQVYQPPFGRSGFILVTVLGLALIAVQGAAAPWTGGAGPEAAVILVVYAAWRAEKWTAVLVAFILGLFRDAAGGGLMGMYQVALILTAWVFHPWRRRVHLEAPLPLTLCVFSLTLGGDLLVLTLLTALLGWPGPGFNPVPAVLVSALASALAAPPLFWILERLPGGRAAGGRHG
jgi:rod shape-determining protein MreD